MQDQKKYWWNICSLDWSSLSVYMWSKQVNCSSSTKRLERDGYVKRIPSPDDKRSILISRTGKDEIFKSKIPGVSDQQNKLFYKGFSTSEIKDFENYLKRILENCKEAESKI